MGINHCSFYILVPQQLLNSANIVATYVASVWQNYDEKYDSQFAWLFLKPELLA